MFGYTDCFIKDGQVNCPMTVHCWATPRRLPEAALISGNFSAFTRQLFAGTIRRRFKNDPPQLAVLLHGSGYVNRLRMH